MVKKVRKELFNFFLKNQFSKLIKNIFLNKKKATN